MKNKKGFLPALFALITVPIIIAIIVLVAVLFGGTSLLTWILAKSVFYLAGIGMILAGIFLAYRGKMMPMWFWILSIVLVVLPYLFNTLKGASLAVLIG